MIRERIIQTTNEHFAKYGIKGVSMGQIAQALGISKKTLYVEFNTKEELIIEAVMYNKRKLLSEFIKVADKISNPVEALLFMGRENIHYYASVCPAFHKDVKRFPEAVKQLSDLKEEVKKRWIDSFLTGVEQGLFRKEQNVHLMMEIFVNEPVLSLENQLFLYMAILRGVSTPAGEMELKRLSQPNDSAFSISSIRKKF